MGLGTKVLSGLNGSYGTYLEGWGGGVIKAPYPYSERIPAGMSEERRWGLLVNTGANRCKFPLGAGRNPPLVTIAEGHDLM
jgi:hypothetical protein